MTAWHVSRHALRVRFHVTLPLLLPGRSSTTPPAPPLGISFKYRTLVPTPRDHSNHIHMDKGHILISLRCGQDHQRLAFCAAGWTIFHMWLFSRILQFAINSVLQLKCWPPLFSHLILQKDQKRNDSHNTFYHHLPSHILIWWIIASGQAWEAPCPCVSECVPGNLISLSASICCCAAPAVLTIAAGRRW